MSVISTSVVSEECARAAGGESGTTYDESSAEEEQPRGQKPRCLEPMGGIPKVGSEFEWSSSHN